MDGSTVHPDIQRAIWDTNTYKSSGGFESATCGKNMISPPRVHYKNFTQITLLTVNQTKHVITAYYKSPTNTLVCIKTLIQMSHTKTLKITSTCFDHQMIITRELSDPG
jgi:hypothetical protein